MNRTALLLGSSLIFVTGCDSAPLPVGGVCEASTECEDGLACLEIGQIDGANCTVIGKICSITCLDDTGCAAFGANFRCFAGCGAERVCGELATL